MATERAQSPMAADLGGCNEAPATSSSTITTQAPAQALASSTTNCDRWPPLQAAAHRPARIVLHAAALLLAIGVLVAECVLISHSGYTYEWMAGTRIAQAPELVIVTAAVAAVLANVLLISALLHSPPAGSVPSYEPLPDDSLAGLPPPALWLPAAEAILLTCVLALWIACVGVSARTVSVIKLYDSGGGVWDHSNTAVLSLECCSVLVWAACLFLSAKPLAPAVRAWKMQWAATSGLDSGPSAISSHPLPAPAATFEPDSEPVHNLRVGLHVFSALLALGALVAQAVFMDRREVAGYGLDWMKGKDFAKAPGLVIATSVLALVLTCSLLAVRARARMSTVRSGQAPWAAATEVVLAAAVVVLWVTSLVVSAGTAAKMNKTQGVPKFWVHSNVAVLVFECCSVLAWAAAMLLSICPLVPVAVECRAGRAAAASSFYQPLDDLENMDAGDTGSAGSSARSDDTRSSNASMAHLCLPVSAALMSVGVLVAQSTLMRHVAVVFTDNYYYGRVKGIDMATAPALVLTTAALALALAVILMARFVYVRMAHTLCQESAGYTGLWAAATEAVLVACVLALWVSSMFVSAKTADFLRKSWFSDGVWDCSNAAALALECCSVPVWTAALWLSVRRLAAAVRKWRPQTSAAGGMGAPSTVPIQVLRPALLVVAALLAIGVLVAESILVGHKAAVTYDYNYYQWWRGSHFATAPELVFVAAVAALLVACLLLVSVSVKWCNVQNWDLFAVPVSCRQAAAAATEIALVSSVLALWVASVGVSAKTVVNLRHPRGMSHVWKHSNTAALVLECCSVVVWAGTMALCIMELLQARAAQKALLAASGQLRALLYDSDDECGGTKSRSGGSTPRTATTCSSGSDKPQPMPLQWTHIVLYGTAFLVAICTLMAQGVLMEHVAYPNCQPYAFTKGKNIATAPGLVILAAALAVLLAGVKLAVAMPLLLRLPLLSAVASSPSLQLWAATAEAELAAMVMALWAASVGVSGKNAYRMRQVALWPGVWVKCNAAVLAFACISVCLWSAGVVLSFRALRLAVQTWQGVQAAAGSGSGPASRAESVSDAA